MEPFAYEKPKSKMSGRLFVAGVAAASLSLWYFDLIPRLDSVPTGTVDSAQQSPTPDDFLALLDAENQSPGSNQQPSDLPLDEIRDSGQSGNVEPDSVFDRMMSDTDPLENSFPEFAGLTEPIPAELDPAETTDSPSVSEYPLANDSVTSTTESTGIQTADFSTTGDQTEIQTASLSTVESGHLATMPAAPVLSAEAAAKLRTIDELIENQSTLRAHALLSEIYLYQPELQPAIQERIDQTAAEIYINPSRHFAEPYVVGFGETMDAIAKKHNVPWAYLARLNSVTPETLQAGQTLKVLKGPFGAIVDLKKFELTVHAHGWYVRRYRIGIGKDHSTPTGDFTVQNKLENPKWFNPDGGVIEADDPTNPLGEFWLGLGNHIGIHGTIDPGSIGKAQSRGCIHMNDRDIAEVFNLLSVGSPVKIRP